MTESTGSLTPEDARIIAAAAKDGRISPDTIDVWCNSMRADRDGTRRMLSSITSIKADLYTAEQVHAAVLGRLGIKPEPTKPRTVAASGDPHADLRERQVLDSLGLPTASTPPPVLLSKGVDVADYNNDQHYSRFLKMLGGQFAKFAGPLPAGDSWYLPSPNDVTRYDEATGQWVEKNPYREI
jgi:hypothetical protein